MPFSQNRKHFRGVMALLFLLTSPTQAISMPKSCVKVGDAWKKNPTATVATDTDFLVNIVDCLLSLGGNDEISRQLQDLIQKLPKLIEKLLPVAKDKAGLLLSAYLAYTSYELHDRAMNLETNLHKKNRHDFEMLQEKTRPIVNFINDQLILQWKSGDISSLQNIALPLLRMLSHLSADITALIDTIKKDIMQAGNDKRLSLAYAAGSVTVCVGTMFSASFAGIGLICLPSVGFVAVSIKSYKSLEETLSELELLWENTAKRRKELARYYANLERIAVTGETVPWPVVEIHIRSEGCDDPGRKPSTCGFAYIEVNGKDYSPHLRGCNVVVVDAATGWVLRGRGFDTFWSSSADNHLREYLNDIKGNKIVLVAVQEEASRHLSSAIGALKRLGAKEPVFPGWRGSFAFAGYAGEDKPLWITQKSEKNRLGPSEISLTIPLSTPSN
ncbi:uncharacterized protein [Montipora capricornis]|uniref:uncharacterized protein n=1 Tax=Montipora capricornis TaxID=246305 RepID=UPI0035F18BBF